MRKLFIASAALVLTGAFLTGCSSLCCCKSETECSVCSAKSVSVNEIKTDELAKLIAEKPGKYTLLDARSGKYYDGKVIQTAKHLGSDSSDAEIAAALPDKKAEIITYCAGVKCPASKILAEKLRKLGYSNVKEYTDGLEAWNAAGKKTVELK